MSGRDGERRRLGLGFATLLSVLVHVVLSMLLAVLTLRRDAAGVHQDERRAPPEAKAKQSASDYELVVAPNNRERPAHESPLEVTVAQPSPRAEVAERPKPVERIAAPRTADAEPVEAPVAIELPRAAAAPRHAVDTPTQLSRQESARGIATAEADASVSVPKAATATVADAPANAAPKPTPRRPSANPRSRSAPAARRAAAAVPPQEAAAAAGRRRASSPVPTVDAPPPSTVARAVTAAAAADAADDTPAESVEPLAQPAEPSREEAVAAVKAPAPAERPRARPSAAASKSVATNAARGGRPPGGDGAVELASPRRGPRADAAANTAKIDAIVADGNASDGIVPLARAGGAGAGAEEADGPGFVASLVGEPTEPPAGDGPPDSPPVSPQARRTTDARRAGPRGQQSSRATSRGTGRRPSAADEAMAEEAFTALVGGRERGIDGGDGALEAPSAAQASASPARRPIEAAGDADPQPVEAADAGTRDAAPAQAADDPFAAIAAASPRGVRQPRGGPRAPVRVRGPEGPGGSEDEAGPQPGITARPNRRPTDSVLENDERFLARVAAAALPVDGRVRQMAAPFVQRSPDRRDQLARGRPRPETEASIEQGLAFLVRAQLPDGRWSLSRFPGATEADVGSIQSDTAATGLALLCFLGAGYDHFGEVHADTVRRGLGFLRAVQKPDGDLYLDSDEASARSARLYSHAIATMALCEAVGMTGDPLIRESAANACRFIASTQHEKRGGWRYAPGIGSDLSVSGWMLLALRSGQLAGIDVDRRCLDGVRILLDTSQSIDDADAYVYNPYAPDTPEQRAGRRPSATMNAVGLLMRLHTGAARDDPRITRLATKLAADLPAIGSRSLPTRDCYLWYYAAQVLFHVGGEAWDRWEGRLHDLLVSSQETGGDRSGSWNPGGTVPDRWGAFGGRIYVTALNLLTLEVSYRHLPIYEVLSRPQDRRDPARSSP